MKTRELGNSSSILQIQGPFQSSCNDANRANQNEASEPIIKKQPVVYHKEEKIDQLHQHLFRITDEDIIYFGFGQVEQQFDNDGYYF